MVCVGGGWGLRGLVGVSARCVCGLVPGGRGNCVGVALQVVWGQGNGAALEGSLGVLLGCVGVACACRAILALPGWPRCRGKAGRWLLLNPGWTVVCRH